MGYNKEDNKLTFLDKVFLFTLVLAGVSRVIGWVFRIPIYIWFWIILIYVIVFYSK